MTTIDPIRPPPVPANAAPPVPRDLRRTPWRPDLAARSLEGRFAAERYADGVRRQVVRPAVAMRRRPIAGAGLENEALFGEVVTVYEESAGWAWGQLDRDGYVGYLPLESLSPAVLDATHAVRALGTFLYSAPDIKSPPLLHLSLNSRVVVAAENGRFLELAGGGYAVSRHLAPLGRAARDFVDVAERFLGTPYLWGGRTRLGLDCSGLVQLAMEAAGLEAPRDSDMQQAEIGGSLGVPDRLEGLQRGDLVFWKGHVAIMTDGVMLLHANAHHMEVFAEPLVEAAERIGKTGSPVLEVRRPERIGARD